MAHEKVKYKYEWGSVVWKQLLTANKHCFKYIWNSSHIKFGHQLIESYFIFSLFVSSTVQMTCSEYLGQKIAVILIRLYGCLLWGLLVAVVENISKFINICLYMWPFCVFQCCLPWFKKIWSICRQHLDRISIYKTPLKNWYRLK